MDWPLASHYTAILQNPAVAFVDPALRECQIRRNAHNQPHGVSGQFAVVFEALMPDGSSRAIRPFTSDRAERTERYQLISDYLAQQTHVSSLVEFQYSERGIRAVPNSGRARLFPLITMQWVDGSTLYEWVLDRCRADERDRLRNLAEDWISVVESLEESQIVHGDLQHGNILVTPSDELKLVDYDGICVPELVGRRNLEIGLPPYQHPQRDMHTPLGLSLDRFSALFIYAALRALAAAPRLWVEFVEARAYDKLLFADFDLAHSTQSELYQALQTSPDPEVPRLTDVLVDAFHGSMDAVPRLREALSTAASTTSPDAAYGGAANYVPTGANPDPYGTAAADWAAPPDPTPFVPPSDGPDTETVPSPIPASDAATGGFADVPDPGIVPAPAEVTPGGDAPSPTAYADPTPDESDTKRRQEPTPGVSAMLIALRDRDREQFCELFDARLVRENVQQFTPYRQLVHDWAMERFRSPEGIGLRPSRGRDSLAASPGSAGTNQARWMWPLSRISQTCLVGLSRRAATSDDAPDDLDLAMKRTVTRENYESGRGVILHTDRSTTGCHVVVWAVIDLGFESMYSEPLTLGRLRTGSGGAPTRSQRW